MRPCYDVWICQGRVCTAAAAEEIAGEARRVVAACITDNEGEPRARVLRGGCYGLCELGPNVVVRRHVGELPDVDVDRLSLTEAQNERVYCGMAPALVDRVVRSHMERDEEIPELLRAERERALPAGSTVAERLRKLRAARDKKRAP